MTSSNSGAVFFLGTRAHYQVLQQPDQNDLENGNESTESVYQNTNAQLWAEDALDNVIDDSEENTGMKRRTRRGTSQTTLCDREEMSPSILNDQDSSTKPKSKRQSVLTLLKLVWSRRRAASERRRHGRGSLAACAYRDACRCLHCQSSYFDCDDSEDYSSEDSDGGWSTRPVECARVVDDDEVFLDNVPDTTSTDLLIQGKEKMSVSSDDYILDDEDKMDLEVAAGTPVLLNYLLTHPLACSIQ